MQKTEEIGKLLDKELKPTSGWFSRWKQRENIIYTKPHGEVGEVDVESADKWVCNMWLTIMNEYSAEDVYIADETALYYRASPEREYVFKKENAKSVKACKERVTMLCKYSR